MVSETATATITVVDTPPSLVVSGPATVDEGQDYTLQLSAWMPRSDTTVFSTTKPDQRIWRTRLRSCQMGTFLWQEPLAG
jgi:hypothetical protein